MNTIRRRRLLIRMASAALAVAVLTTGLIPDVLDTASARKRSNAEFVQGFSNATSIAISSSGQSNPSEILVSGFTTEIADVNVTLANLSHGKPGDVDVLLVGPGGQNALILSDVGSSANNVTLTLDDQAANQVSSSGALTNGTFQPTNFQSAGDSFTPPAPSPAGGSELGVFNSTDPNGIWTLYIRNGSSTTGALNGGWSLNITSANGVPNASPDSFAVQAGKALNEPSGVLTNDRDPDDDVLTAILTGQAKKGKVELQPDGSFTYRASKKAKGTDSFSYLARDPGGLSDLETVTIQIKKAKKKGKK